MPLKTRGLIFALIFSFPLTKPRLLIIAAAGNGDALEPELKIIREFPSEEQMIRDDYVLGRSGQFDWIDHRVHREKFNACEKVFFG